MVRGWRRHLLKRSGGGEGGRATPLKPSLLPIKSQCDGVALDFCQYSKLWINVAENDANCVRTLGSDVMRYTVESCFDYYTNEPFLRNDSSLRTSEISHF